MASSARKTVSITEAAQILGISRQLMHWRALHGKLPIARRHPMRFRLVEVLANREQLSFVHRQYPG